MLWKHSMVLYDALETLYDALEILYDALETLYGSQKTPHQKPHLRETFWKPSGKLPGNEFFLPGHAAERSTTLFDALETLYDALRRSTSTL